jgi:hypothetical protein
MRCSVFYFNIIGFKNQGGLRIIPGFQQIVNLVYFLLTDYFADRFGQAHRDFNYRMLLLSFLYLVLCGYNHKVPFAFAV